MLSLRTYSATASAAPSNCLADRRWSFAGTETESIKAGMQPKQPHPRLRIPS